MQRDDLRKMISVIVLVYNTCEYLSHCIDSILRQTYAELEVILVDDGSTDGSEELCDVYAEQDQRIKVIHQPNMGMVEARDQGIKAASGAYVVFIDSDDYIDVTMFEELERIAEINNADIVTSGYIKEYWNENGVITEKAMHDALPEGLYDTKDKGYICENMMCFNKYSSYGIMHTLCCKLFKRKLLQQNLGRIPRNITYAEDACRTYICCIDADRIYVTHRIFYHYYMRKNSCTHSSERKCFAILNDCYECICQKILEQQNYQDALFHQLEMFVAREAIFCLNNRFGFFSGGILPSYVVNLTGWNSNTKLVLYGAGRIGKSYYKQIKALGQAEIILWVDKDQRIVKQNSLVQPVQSILDVKYDYILIGVMDNILADNIRLELQQFGIDQKKIVWRKPEFILDIYNT